MESNSTRIARMEEKLNNIEVKVDDLNAFMKDHCKWSECIVKELTAKFENKFVEQEKKFAGKWVEIVLWSGGGVVGVALLGAILALILK